MEIRDRFTCTKCLGLFPDGLSRQKPVGLALPEMCPTLFRKIPGGFLELNETQTNLESMEHKNK